MTDAGKLGEQIIAQLSANLRALSTDQAKHEAAAIDEYELARLLFSEHILYFADYQAADAEKPLITLHQDKISSTLKAQTQKPSNIVINFSNLVRITSGIGKVAIGGASGSNLLLMTAILMLVADLTNLTCIDFAQPIPYVVKAIWQLRYTKPTTEPILDKTNSLLAVDGLPLIDQARVETCLDTLVRCRCVSLHFDGHYSLEESVRLDADASSQENSANL